MKIYSDDNNLPYKSTTKRPIDSKTDIDAILAKYGITKTAWDWDINNDKVTLQFQLSEVFKEVEVNPVIKLKPPIIWKRRKKGKPEEIDWRLSMRILHWYIKDALTWSYANQSERTVAFLPHILVNEEQTVKDVVIPDLKNMKALPNPDPAKVILDA